METFTGGGGWVMAYALSGYAWRGEKYRETTTDSGIEIQSANKNKSSSKALTLIFIFSSTSGFWDDRWAFLFLSERLLRIISVARRKCTNLSWESLNPFFRRTHICQRRLHFQNEIEDVGKGGKTNFRRDGKQRVEMTQTGGILFDPIQLKKLFNLSFAMLAERW